MAREYWFRPHKYSFGWAPATWQGWLVILLYLGSLIYSYVHSDTISDFLPKFLILSGILICITYLTGEPHSWKWKERKE
ncbi:MAG TPA: hypothetical protein VLF20_01260 [Patescibacteria group bacterium]|nr:hypothetical protein [Patescibacteria group bacterium]